MDLTWPPAFTVDAESVLRLFTGDRFYSSSDAALREGILNAIDACGRRHLLEPMVEPSIEVVFDDNAKTVSISDDGDGMGRDELGALFARVGASAAKLAQQAQDQRYRAVGEFGIGVVSYFLICDRYQVHTLRSSEEPLALEFSSTMLDGRTAAQAIACARQSVGTTVVLFVRDDSTYQHLLSRFSHWARAVDGLVAVRQPSGAEIPQGGLSTKVSRVEVTHPNWIEASVLGPPSGVDSWNRLDGSAHVAVLYRGVFVEEVTVEHLWGIEGVIHVDPKHFKPKLNREGFVGPQVKEEVTRFLQEVHPQALLLAAQCLATMLGTENLSAWTLPRWASLWLAVPRTGPYGAAVAAWDELFQTRKAFRVLQADDGEREISVADLRALGATVVYVAPQLDRATDLVKQAVRVLRAKGLLVVQGIARATDFLVHASFLGQSTAELLLNYFRSVLPELIQVESVAEQVVSQESVATVFEDEPKVRLVRLGDVGAPLVAAKGEVWINVDSASGRRIVTELCDRNEGHLGLWVACLMHAPGHVAGVAPLLQRGPEEAVRLGPVNRQYLRRFAA